MNEGSARQQIVEAIKGNSNILVTVSDSPSVDELSAALGLTVLLNKMDKRATAIFSGAIPPALQFLEPEKTLEGTVDSLRDFIIALDKEKADHLRYKVDGDVVKIFITPYRTTLSQEDLQFSQGDYNVELVIALGVKDQDHLDNALAAHGKILHDATVTTITAGADASTLGSVDWHDAASSSLSEMLVSLVEPLKEDAPLLDEQIASAFLTGIVSATDRFSNDRTTSRVMTMAAQLMAAGANQQLIAAKLQEAHEIGPDSVQAANNPDGTINIAEDTSTEVEKEEEQAKDDGSELNIERTEEPVEQIAPEPASVVVPIPEPVVASPPVPAPEPLQLPAVPEPAVASAPTPEEEPELVIPPPVINGLKTVEPLSDDIQPAEGPLNPAAAQAEAANPELQELESQPIETDLEKQLAEQLGQTQSAVAPPLVDLEKELKADDTAVPAPEPSLPPLPEPAVTPAAPADTGMPGFEPLDVPAPAAAPELSPFIETHSNGSYLTPSTPSSFDSAVEGVEATTAPAGDTAPDPFSVPLPPLPEPTTVVPEPALATPPANVAADAPLPPPPSVSDMPPLPPLPDFSTLPPLPTPPPPPAFDQPPVASTSIPTQAGAISADKLGDIFGDPPAPIPADQSTSPAPTTPPPPGQFKIPGQ